jgi:hypothetical protein
MISNHLVGFLVVGITLWPPCSILLVYAMAHKGKATSDVTYNSEDGPEAYNNPTVHIRLSEYTAMAKEVYGPEYDARTEDIDRDVLMRVGERKNQDAWVVLDYRHPIDLSCTPTLSQVRARSASVSLAI